MNNLYKIVKEYKEMKVLDNETMAELSQWELDFRRAISSNFIGMKTSDFQHLAGIYARVFGETLTRPQMGCNTCRLTAIKRLGQAYFDTKAYEEEQALKQAEEKPKKKAGRPKKLDVKSE